MSFVHKYLSRAIWALSDELSTVIIWICCDGDDDDDDDDDGEVDDAADDDDNDDDDAMDVLELHYCPPNFVGYVATSDCAGYCKCKTTSTTSSDQQMSQQQQRRRRRRRRHMAKQIKSCIVDGLLFDSTLQICTWAEDVHDSNMRQLKQKEKQRGGEACVAQEVPHQLEEEA